MEMNLETIKNIALVRVLYTREGRKAFRENVVKRAKSKESLEEIRKVIDETESFYPSFLEYFNIPNTEKKEKQSLADIILDLNYDDSKDDLLLDRFYENESKSLIDELDKSFFEGR